jgi:hypothetical protein
MMPMVGGETRIQVVNVHYCVSPLVKIRFRCVVASVISCSSVSHVGLSIGISVEEKDIANGGGQSAIINPVSKAPRRLTSCCVLIPFYGEWPPWIDLFLASCRWNPTIDWLIITDNIAPGDPPANVRIANLGWDDLVELIRSTCGLNTGPSKPYRLCDYRFAYGDIFRRFLTGYEFWGFGDIDVIYGNLRAFLPEILFAHDLLTFNATHVSGHFTLLRNSDAVVSRYRHDRAWRERVELPRAQMLDEANGYYGIENVYAVESYNTPLSPHIPWIGGKFSFPTIWYFEEGRLTNNIDGDREFMYLHFMRYKPGWQHKARTDLLQVNSSATLCAWKLTSEGFRPLETGDRSKEAGESVRIIPADDTRREPLP